MATVTGILEWPKHAEGRVRQLGSDGPHATDQDPFVPLYFGQRYNLRPGLEITVAVGQRRSKRRRRGGPGQSGPYQGQPGAGPNGQGGRPVVESILAIEGLDPERFKALKPFEELTSIDPQPRLALEHPGCAPSCRLIDLFCPIGRGQRGLIVSPPKAGKTTLLKDITTGLVRNHPELEVVILLVDERPEEVTDFRRTFAAYAEPPTDDSGRRRLARCRVVASSNDHDVEQHIALCTGTIERCKRLVEAGRHVVVLLDSLTRVGRAFNRSRRHASSGRTMTGGIDSRALEVPKQLFGSARNTEEAGSLTIIASCLVDTGSAGDQVIFEEFKGTGNMELILDRKISERRLFPAINLAASGTRKEHLLMPEQELKTVTALRRRLMAMQPPQQVEQLLAALQRFPTNAALVGSAG
ncbi:MAG TPA: transcription termination factor Rho [Phycisphaerales bacterium]|nr:transcription termination factor Rho [Phycisphaerales bacterium]